MNKTYLTLMREAKNKDAKAYEILNKIKNHPLFDFLWPYQKEIIGWVFLMLLAGFCLQFSYLPFFPLITLILEIAAFCMMYNYVSVVFRRKKKIETDSMERLPAKFMIASEIVAVVLSLLAFLSHISPEFFYTSPKTITGLSILPVVLSFFSFLLFYMITWGFTKDLDKTCISHEEYEYLNEFFKKNAPRDEEGHIRERYCVTNEGAVYYYRNGNVISVIPKGELKLEMIKGIYKNLEPLE